MSPEPAPETDLANEIECESNDLVAEYGGERAALRAVLHDFAVLLADADRSVSRGSVRRSTSARREW
ncbi:hypothetical protein AB4Z10_10505 [Bosea sp. RAF48]|uniref:hypothetical protein n=1 Tax=Bosea sp. RAF48 TaxID=3237480 RepID=UPI003F90C1EC